MKDQIVEKIKKLLRMKRGGTPDEIATALRLAQELAEKHGIDLDSVNPDEECKEQPIGHEEPIRSSRIQNECLYAGLICQEFFNVEVFTRLVDGKFSARGWKRVYIYGLTFVGTEWDRQIAIYVFHFLVKHFRREWNTNSGRLKKRAAFMWGMYLGLRSKLHERRPPVIQQEGLLRIERQLQRRKNYVAEHFGELTSESAAPDEQSDAARYRGFIAGRKTEIRQGVKGSDASDEIVGNGSVKLLQ